MNDQAATPAGVAVLVLLVGLAGLGSLVYLGTADPARQGSQDPGPGAGEPLWFQMRPSPDGHWATLTAQQGETDTATTLTFQIANGSRTACWTTDTIQERCRQPVSGQDEVAAGDRLYLPCPGPGHSQVVVRHHGQDAGGGTVECRGSPFGGGGGS